MTMPEAPVNECHHAVHWQDNVGASRSCLVSRLVRRLARRYPTAEQLSNSGFAALVCSNQMFPGSAHKVAS
jgi:hypothetical protein